MVVTKLYGYDWWTKLTRVGGDPYQRCADALQAAGVDVVIAQNSLDPLPESDVHQSPPPAYDERRFRQVLRSRGIKVYESTAMFFQPDTYSKHPDLRPVDSTGALQQRIGWYVGLCPSSEEYLEERATLLKRVVRQLEPEGLFLSFIRFPGFWEMWTPGVDRAQIPEYCFCRRCLRRFSQETGNPVPSDAQVAAALLQGELRRAWTDWKCSLIARTVKQVRQATQQVAPGTQIMVNLTPFAREELDGVVEEVLGQRVEALDPVTDYFEVMVYHQILKRDPREWIPQLVAELQRRTDRTIIPTLQVRATYLDGLYASAGRRPVIGPAEFQSCVEAVQSSGAEAIGIYHWADILVEDEMSAGGFSAALASFAVSQGQRTCRRPREPSERL